jgi:hypothetical protein
VAERTAATLPRRLGLVLAVVPVLAIGLADAVIAVRTATPATAPATTAARAPGSRVNGSPGGLLPAERAAAIRHLLDRRAQAIVRRDRAAFLATVDPSQPRFVAAQRRLFDGMRAVPFASWSYSFDARSALAPNAATRRYRAPTWAPRHFSANYEIKGFDARPDTLAQFPTFVHRPQGWFLASFSDYAATHPAAVDIWDFGPVSVARAGGVIVLGHPGHAVLLRSVAAEAAAAIPRVTAVWGRDWPRRVVILVPSTQTELARIVDDPEDLSQIAAVASAEVRDCPGAPDPVGDRIAVNPRNWTTLSALGQRIVLTHEETHVASRADTGGCTPTWLVEGLADYAGYLDTGVPVTVVAEELTADVRAGRVPAKLPTDAEFGGANKRLAQAYEGAWLACRMIADRWGQPALLRLYQAVGTSTLPRAAAVDAAMQSVLHLSTAAFVREWRSYLREQLG